VESDDGSTVLISTSPSVVPESDDEMVRVAEQDCCSRINHEVGVELTAGERYFIRGYMKEGRGRDYFSIGVTNPDGSETFPLQPQDLGFRDSGDRVLRCGSPRGCVSFYENIEGNDVADLFNAAKFPGSPDSVVELQGALTTPRNRADNYGVRMEAWFSPGLTGGYTFIVESDDGSTVLISTTPNVVPQSDDEMVRVAQQDCCNKIRHEIRVDLQAGESYFIRGYMKESRGQDYFSIGVTNPNGFETFPLQAQDDGFTDTNVECVFCSQSVPQCQQGCRNCEIRPQTCTECSTAVCLDDVECVFCSQSVPQCRPGCRFCEVRPQTCTECSTAVCLDDVPVSSF